VRIPTVGTRITLALVVVAACCILLIGPGGERGASDSEGGPDGGPRELPEWGKPAQHPLREFASSRVKVHAGTGIALIEVPAGTYRRGGPHRYSESDHESEREHSVVISRPFYLGLTEVTEAQWFLVMGSAPSGCGTRDDVPVRNVSFRDVQEFLGKTGFRLPTEAEWEHAAGALDVEPDDVAWHSHHPRLIKGGPMPVSMLAPNRLGIFDIFGNVSEWCADWTDGFLYEQMYPDLAKGLTDPAGLPNGASRAIRGGSYRDSPKYCTPWTRLCSEPDERWADVGFRVARDLSAPDTHPEPGR